MQPGRGPRLPGFFLQKHFCWRLARSKKLLLWPAKWFGLQRPAHTRQEWQRPEKCSRVCSGALSAFLFLGVSRSRFGSIVFNHGDGAVLLDKSCIGHATDVRLTDLINFLHIPEQLAPIAIA